jgi:hypothetical protein
VNESDQLRVACPSCGKRLRVKAALEGKRLKCPSCSNPFEARPEKEDPEQEVLPNTRGLVRPAQGKQKAYGAIPQARTLPWPFIGVTGAAIVASGLFIFLWLGAKSEARNLKDQLAVAETKIQQATSLVGDLKKQLAAATTNPGDPKTPAKTADPVPMDPKADPAPELLPTGRYKIFWEVPSYVSGGIFVGARDRGDEVEVYKSADKTFLKIAKSKFNTGPPSEITVKGGILEFTGSYCVQDALRFVGERKGTTVTGTLHGKLRDQTGSLSGKDTFTLTPIK